MDGKELIKAEAKAKLLKLDLSNNAHQPAMKSILTDLELECDGNSADKLRNVLTPIKEALIAENNTEQGENKLQDTKTKELEDAKTKELEDAKAKELEDAKTKELEDAKTKELASISKGNFIMKVGHLSWGNRNMNHFYADKRPLINAKKMGKYYPTLLIWLNKGWIEKGSYK